MSLHNDDIQIFLAIWFIYISRVLDLLIFAWHFEPPQGWEDDEDYYNDDDDDDYDYYDDEDDGMWWLISACFMLSFLFFLKFISYF